MLTVVITIDLEAKLINPIPSQPLSWVRFKPRGEVPILAPIKFASALRSNIEIKANKAKLIKQSYSAQTRTRGA